jgi:hypothetical protein
VAIAQFEEQHWLPGDQPYGAFRTCITNRLLAKRHPDGGRSRHVGHQRLRHKVELSQPKLGYIKAAPNFAALYDGNGGFFPHDGGTFFPPAFPEMHIDEGRVG